MTSIGEKIRFRAKQLEPIRREALSFLRENPAIKYKDFVGIYTEKYPNMRKATLGSWFYKQRGPLRPRITSIMFDRRREAMLKLREQGYTLEEIGRKYGVTRERVRQILKKAKIKEEE